MDGPNSFGEIDIEFKRDRWTMASQPSTGSLSTLNPEGSTVLKKNPIGFIWQGNDDPQS